jgi:uncharacterized lipoprotein YehR (DUF1307 family)
MRRALIFILTMFLILTFTGCGDDDGGGGQEDADAVFDAAQYAMTSAYTTALLNSTPTPSMKSQKAVYADGLTFPGECGGNIEISGTYTYVNSPTMQYSSELTVNFNSFCYAGTTITGYSSLSVNMSSNGSSFTYSMVYTGNVVVTGNVTGTASWNLTVSTSASGVYISGTMTVNGTTYSYNQSIAF